jgi:hypothetical protein
MLREVPCVSQSLSKHEDLEFFEDKIEKGLVAQIVRPSSPRGIFADFWSHWPIGSKAHQEIGKPAG